MSLFWARQLRPGDRVLVNDSGLKAEVTVIGYQRLWGSSQTLVGPARRIWDSQVLLGGARPRIVRAGGPHARSRSPADTVLVQRDFACGFSSFEQADLMKKLNEGEDLELRAQRICEILEANARFQAEPKASSLSARLLPGSPSVTFTPQGCLGCLAYCEDPRDLFAEHRGGPYGQGPENCAGLALIPEMSLLLEELGVDVWSEAPAGGVRVPA